MRKQTLIVFGNCQAQGIASVLTKHPAIRELFDVKYLRSFEHPVEGIAELKEEHVTRCGLVLEQHDQSNVVPFPEGLPRGTPRVTFPSADLNLLWPLWSVNPFNVPEPPRFPHGRFTYGDKVVLTQLEGGATTEEALVYYLECSRRDLPNLDQLLRLERARLMRRDTQCDIKMAPIILERFQHERLFWTMNHPTHALLRVLMNALLAHAANLDPRLAGVVLDEAFFETYFSVEMLGQIAVPIHPGVAEHFALSWYDPYEEWVYYGETRTYESYFREMIEYCAAARQEKQLR